MSTNVKGKDGKPPPTAATNLIGKGYHPHGLSGAN